MSVNTLLLVFHMRHRLVFLAREDEVRLRGLRFGRRAVHVVHRRTHRAAVARWLDVVIDRHDDASSLGTDLLEPVRDELHRPPLPLVSVRGRPPPGIDDSKRDPVEQPQQALASVRIIQVEARTAQIPDGLVEIPEFHAAHARQPLQPLLTDALPLAVEIQSQDPPALALECAPGVAPRGHRKRHVRPGERLTGIRIARHERMGAGGEQQSRAKPVDGRQRFGQLGTPKRFAHPGVANGLTMQDVQSGAKHRPQRELVMDAARRRSRDVVLVWRLDRWGRSLSDLVLRLKELAELGAFVSLTEAFDLTTSTGRAMAGMVAVFAEFEREIRRERVTAGIEQARRKGR